MKEINDIVRCDYCYGRGWWEYDGNTHLDARIGGGGWVTVKCSQCDGKGWIRAETSKEQDAKNFGK